MSPGSRSAAELPSALESSLVPFSSWSLGSILLFLLVVFFMTASGSLLFSSCLDTAFGLDYYSCPNILHLPQFIPPGCSPIEPPPP